MPQNTLDDLVNIHSGSGLGNWSMAWANDEPDHRGGTDYGDCSYRARTTPLG